MLETHRALTFLTNPINISDISITPIFELSIILLGIWQDLSFQEFTEMWQQSEY